MAGDRGDDARGAAVDALERAASVPLDEHSERFAEPRAYRLPRGKDVLGDAVSHVEDPRARLQLLERLGDPTSLGYEADRQGMCERGADATRVPAPVEAVLEALDEIRV